MPTGRKAPNDSVYETNLSRVLSVFIIFAFITFVLYIILTQWMHFLPQMEEVGDETKELIESQSGSNSVQVIQSDYVSEIRQAQAISFVCFGILDSIFAFLLWKKPRTDKNEDRVIAMGFLYPFIRWFSAFVIIMASIVIVTSSVSPSTLYLVIAIFSGMSLLFILYLRKSISSDKLNKDVVFKIPNENIS